MNLNIYYQNVRGLRTKTDKFRQDVMATLYDVILLCETWLIISDIGDAGLFDNTYVVYKNDRDSVTTGHTLGGGCLIAVKSMLFPKREKVLELDKEMCAFLLNMRMVAKHFLM